jgi:carboxyl-terminal processing protease
MELNGKPSGSLLWKLWKIPALKAGIKAGDQILAVDGKTTVGLKVEDASKLIRGKAGTPITLRVARQGRVALM